MSERDKALLEGILQMKDQASLLGVCPFPFGVLYDEVCRIMAERDALASQAGK